MNRVRGPAVAVAIVAIVGFLAFLRLIVIPLVLGEP